MSGELANLLKSRVWVSSCSVIANGVDTEEYRSDGPTANWRGSIGIPRDALLIGHVGRFDSNKCQGDLIKAVRSLRLPLQVFLIFVGSGSLLETMKDLAGNDDHIRFIPHLNDVATLLRNLDLFVICSKHEGAPLAMLEAMACERAVIATEVGGIPEILNGHEGGVLVPPSNPAELAKAIVRLSTSVENRLEMGGRARRRVIGDYTIQQQWRRYDEIYRSCTSGLSQ